MPNTKNNSRITTRANSTVLWPFSFINFESILFISGSEKIISLRIKLPGARFKVGKFAERTI